MHWVVGRGNSPGKDKRTVFRSLTQGSLNNSKMLIAQVPLQFKVVALVSHIEIVHHFRRVVDMAT